MKEEHGESRIMDGTDGTVGIITALPDRRYGPQTLAGDAIMGLCADLIRQGCTRFIGGT